MSAFKSEFGQEMRENRNASDDQCDIITCPGQILHSS
jgi:hypothetical protein